MKALLGLAIVAAHGVGFALLAPAGTDLAVGVDAPLSSKRFTLTGKVPPALARRVETRIDGDGPGLDRRRWSITYRGGYTREVGASQLVGPFQDPAQPPCSGRVIVGQALLDELSPLVAKAIDAELHGESIVGAGDYQKTRDVAVAWTRVEAHADDAMWAPDLAGGYVRVTATLAFQRVAIPLTILLVPEMKADGLGFRVETRASLAFDNTVVQWISDKIGGSKLATRLARRQIDASLVAALAPPPPFDLPGGGTLRFLYCGTRPEVQAGWAALPFAVAIGDNAVSGIRPPKLGDTPNAPPPPGVLAALDLDVDALNAILFELWRTGYLDRRLADVGLDRRFNTDPLVTEFLTVRLSPITLALPPVVSVDPKGLRLAADARVTITDGDTKTVGRVWGALAFSVAPPMTAVAVDVSGVELACEQPPDLLVPCYGDLVDAMRGRAGDFHGALTTAFGDLLAAIFVDRHLGDPRLPGELVIEKAVPTLHGGTLRLELTAHLRGS